jgi:hypothetical protein
MGQLKTDETYGYAVDLKYGRELPYGHKLDTRGIRTDVDALRKILDLYLDTSTMESTMDITNHKIDFSVTFLDAILLIVSEKLTKAFEYLADVDAQLQDISHRIIKPSLSGQAMGKEDKIAIYDMQEDLLIRRRNLKDAISILKVMQENIEKTRNFNLSMNNRMYRPKSERFQPDPDFYIGKAADKNKPEDTRINTDAVS